MKTKELMNIIRNEHSPVFKSREVFEMEYIPDIYNYRDEQLTKMATFCSSIPYDIAPKNLLLTGGNATGKTTTLKAFFNMLNDEFSNVETVYINCQLYNTENMVYSKIYKQLFNIEDSTVGKTNTFLFKAITNKIQEDNTILIIGLDDFDNFKSIEGLNKMLYRFLRAHEMVGNIQISIFTVSNRNDLILNPSVDTIFNRVPIIFDQYSLEQMYHILHDRCEYGFAKGVIDDEMIRYVAKKSYDTGNLRYGINLLSSAGQKAEVFGSGKILRNYLD